MVKATIQTELRDNNRGTDTASDSVAGIEKTSATTMNTPEPEIRKIPKDYLLNSKLSVLSAWQCWHMGEQQGTGGDSENGSGTKPYVTVPWKELRKEDLDGSNKGQQSSLSNLKFLCERLDAAAAATFQKLPNSTSSLTDLATAFRSESFIGLRLRVRFVSFIFPAIDEK